MRPIRFRIWHVRLKLLLLVTGIEFDVGEISSINFLDPATKKFATEDIFIRYYKPTVYLMQFTGLRDKRGEEIFEGDIVEWKGEMGQIMFSVGRFVFANSAGWKDNLLVNDQLEIIGNIWENEELLSQVQLPPSGISLEEMIEAYDKFHPRA